LVHVDIAQPSRARSDVLSDVPRALEVLLLITAALAALSWILVAVVNLNDRALISWDDGARMGLAGYLRAGTFYPPLFDGIHYGGTRFMPIPILLHGVLSFLTGELLSSGKLATYISFAALAGAMVAAMRRLGSTLGRAIVLIACIVVTQVGVLASLAASPDALPVALQLGALLLVVRSESRSTETMAGILCSAALFSKLSAFWGFAAIGVWLWRRNRRPPVPFLVASFVSSAGFLTLVQLATGGRFMDNMLGLSTSGLAGGGIASLADSAIEIIPAAPTFYFLLPIAAIETAIAIRRGELSIFHLAFVFAIPIAVAVQFDVGASTNHFLDVICLEAVLTARLWARWDGVVGRAAIVPVVVTFAIISSFPTGLRLPMQDAVRQAISGETARAQRVQPLEGIVGPSDEVLSEDATIPLGLGHLPVVLDPFMLARIGARYPTLIEPLIDRVERRDFDYIVLVWRLDEPPFEHWYSRNHLGAGVTRAIRENYVYVGESANFDIYVPRDS
jgi:hypothetical protein